MGLTPYIDKEGCENVNTHQYHAINLGISYHAFWGPLSEACVKCVPKYIA